MIDSFQNQEKEIDHSNNEEEEKTAMEPLKEYLIIRKKENASIIVNIALVMTHYLNQTHLLPSNILLIPLKKVV